MTVHHTFDAKTHAGSTPGVAPKKELDLVFTMDVTGSMGSYINAAKQNIQAIARRLVQEEGYSVQFGLVAYRDHPPQDMSFVSKSFAFTSEVDKMAANLATLHAHGGGDGPEAVEAGLLDTLHMQWRDDAAKICVLIADAPPHGLGEAGDGFANGAPTGVDPLVVLDGMSQRGITIYSVGCQPALSAYAYATDFFIAAAERTNGQAVALGSAACLADVILGGAIEEMDLQSLKAELHERVKTLTAEQPGLGEDEVQEQVYRAMSGGGTRSRRLKVPRLASETSGLVARADSLDQAKAALSNIRIESSTSMGYAAGLKHTAPGATLGAIAEPPALRRMASGFGGPALGPPAAEMPMYRGLSAAIDDDEAPSCGYRSLAAADDAPSGVVYRSAAAAAAPAPAATEVGDVKLEESDLSREQFNRFFKKEKAAGAF